ncbi:MAG: hypothetical protein WC802_05260 [Patescibacteria group bacterium]
MTTFGGKMFSEEMVHTVHLTVSEADAWRLAYATAVEEPAKILRVPSFIFYWCNVVGEA